MEQKFQDIVREYRRQSGHSVRGFAEWLTEKIVNTTLSGETISKWENDPNRAPDLYLFFNIYTTYTDQRMYFAVDSLKALLPHVFDSEMVIFRLPKVE